MGHIKLETRGLVYLDEVRHIHRMILKKARDIYENTIKDVPDMEEKDLIKLIRADMEKFLLQINYQFQQQKFNYLYKKT